MQLRGDFPKVEWRRLVCNNVATPNWNFIFYLALTEWLQTKERLATWGIVDEINCVLCSAGTDSNERLFFQCSFTAAI